ncbi:MAG TPA: hypothetical protein VFX86_02685 [Candidatus Saccharimonadales bacterium]|nr:hypothetical protein [Candidatus Saccharimonadales bacterium]
MREIYSLYDQIIEITKDYLGPAAKRFIDRQITSHLDKAPEDLKPSDMPKLIIWIEAVISLLTNDEKIIAEYIDNLKSLSQDAKQNR